MASGPRFSFPAARFRRAWILTSGLALLAACGSREPQTTGEVGENVAAAAAEGVPANVAAAIDCGNRPDFVPVYRDAEITTCVAGPDGLGRHVSGTIVYLTDAAPDEVLGWSRAQSDASGLRFRSASESRYSAGEERRRSLMVVVEPVGGRTRVTVNWGKPA
ncbi:hypothetical protein ACX40Y_03230 [Sphingomonas sp. RS6]